MTWTNSVSLSSFYSPFVSYRTQFSQIFYYWTRKEKYAAMWCNFIILTTYKLIANWTETITIIFRYFLARYRNFLPQIYQKVHQVPQNLPHAFYRPVFRRDVLWYGDVRPGLRPSDSPSVRPGLRPSVRPFSALFSYILWHIELKFCTWLCFWCTTDQVRLSSLCVNFYYYYYYTSVFRRALLWYGDVCPSGSPSVRLSVRPSVRPGLRPPVFHTFLQHALTYWAEILHMTLFYCTTDQVQVSSICVKFCGSYAPFGT